MAWSVEKKLAFGIYVIKVHYKIDTTTDSTETTTEATTIAPTDPPTDPPTPEPTTEPTTESPPQCDVLGKCQGSEVLTYSFTRDEVECLNLCKHYTSYQSNCNFITFDADTGLCELFEECPILGDLGDCDNCVSYDVRCDTEADPLTTCYVPGNCQVQSCKLKII